MPYCARQQVKVPDAQLAALSQLARGLRQRTLQDVLASQRMHEALQRAPPRKVRLEVLRLGFEVGDGGGGVLAAGAAEAWVGLQQPEERE